jgi:hypothetical protein
LVWLFTIELARVLSLKLASATLVVASLLPAQYVPDLRSVPPMLSAGQTHRPVLHSLTSWSYQEPRTFGHALPPCLGCSSRRVRRWWPVLHDLEQRDQPPHPWIRQWTGHGCVLHLRDSVRAGQALPPFRAAVVTRRVRVCVPEAHDLEQPV